MDSHARHSLFKVTCDISNDFSRVYIRQRIKHKETFSVIPQYREVSGKVTLRSWQKYFGDRNTTATTQTMCMMQTFPTLARLLVHDDHFASALVIGTETTN